MKKSDLEFGNVVELRKGDKLLLYYSLASEKLISLIGCGYTMMDSYHEDLTNINGFENLDIMKVYKDYTCKELLWERKEKPKLTEDEKVVLKNIDKKYKWIERNSDGHLFVTTNAGFCVYLIVFDHLFQFIQWEDEEPYLIEDLLKGE